MSMWYTGCESYDIAWNRCCYCLIQCSTFINSRSKQANRRWKIINNIIVTSLRLARDHSVNYLLQYVLRLVFFYCPQWRQRRWRQWQWRRWNSQRMVGRMVYVIDTRRYYNITGDLYSKYMYRMNWCVSALYLLNARHIRWKYQSRV